MSCYWQNIIRYLQKIVYIVWEFNLRLRNIQPSIDISYWMKHYVEQINVEFN
jgi:hypothetical protein